MTCQALIVSSILMALTLIVGAFLKDAARLGWASLSIRFLYTDVILAKQS
jgi:hypothetical protein